MYNVNLAKKHECPNSLHQQGRNCSLHLLPVWQVLETFLLVKINMCRTLPLTYFLEVGQRAFMVVEVFFSKEQTRPAYGDVVTVIQVGLVCDFAAIDKHTVPAVHISHIMPAAVGIEANPHMLA